MGGSAWCCARRSLAGATDKNVRRCASRVEWSVSVHGGTGSLGQMPARRQRWETARRKGGSANSALEGLVRTMVHVGPGCAGGECSCVSRLSGEVCCCRPRSEAGLRRPKLAMGCDVRRHELVVETRCVGDNHVCPQSGVGLRLKTFIVLPNISLCLCAPGCLSPRGPSA